MKLIIGLGNPGEKYRENRHNVGFMVVDRLVEELRVRGCGLNQEWEESKKGKLQYIWFDIEGKKLEFIKPQSFMNKSGYSVVYAYKKHSLSSDDLYIIHDDLDLRLGSYKIQFGKGPKLHKGLESIDRELNTSNYWHLRIGVDNRPPDNRISGEEYVLQDFTKEEKDILNKVIEKIVIELKVSAEIYG